MKTKGFVFPILAMIIFVGCSNNNLLQEVSGVWKGSNIGLITLNLVGEKKTIEIGGKEGTVTVKDIDTENHIIPLYVTLANGQKVIWTLRQIRDDETNTFILLLTTHSGAQEPLSFVRKL
jgi:hypothetical protein